MSNKHWCMPKYFTLDAHKKDPSWREECSLGDDLKIINALQHQYKIGNHHVLTGQEHYGPNEQQGAFQIICLQVEAALIKAKTPSIFVDSQSLARFLHESTYDAGLALKAISNIPFKWFCFPVMNIAGVNTRSMAFGTVGDPKCGMFSFYTSMPPDAKIVIPFTRDAVADLITNKPLEYFDTIPTNWVRIIRPLIRLCFSVCVYAEAFPDHIRDGLPDSVHVEANTNSRVITAAPEILEGATRTSVSMHIRAGHFKTLQHERFKRNEDGTAKVIFVRQTIVAGKLTPKTAVGL